MFEGSKPVLKAPAFDLAWITDTRDVNASGESVDSVCLAPGGGGSMKSGVKNQVQLLRHLDDRSCLYYRGYETDSTTDSGTGICTGVCSATLVDGTHVVAVLIDDMCKLCSVVRKPDFEKPNASPQSVNGKRQAYVSSRAPLPDSGLEFHLIDHFRADFSEDRKEGGASCCAIATVVSTVCEGDTCSKIVQDLLVIGGNDGNVRVWKIEVAPESEIGNNNSKDGKNLPATHRIALQSTFKGHTAPVTSVQIHTERPWVVSSSKDGGVRLWDLSVIDSDSDDARLMTLPFVENDLPAGGWSSRGAKKPSNIKQARGAFFSSGLDVPPAISISASVHEGDEDAVVDCDNYYLYSLQCAKNGPTHLLKWRLACELRDVKTKLTAPPRQGMSAPSTKTVTTVKASLESAVFVCSGPATRLSTSSSGLFVAVGCSDGNVSVYSNQLKKYSQYLCHDLPVTGLSFAPEDVAIQHAVPEVLCSVSADNRLAVIPLGGVSYWFETFSRIVFTLIVLLLAIVTFTLLSGMVGPNISIV